MNYDWEPKLQYSMEHLGYLLYMVRKTPTGVEFMTNTGKIVKQTPNTQAKENLWMARFEDTAQLRKLIEEVENHGVKSPSTDRVEGELTAVKEHLADMRQLVFKETPKAPEQTGKMRL